MLRPDDDFRRVNGRCFRHTDSGHGKLVGVRITVLGCSGSVVGPDSPASGYLLTAPDTPPLVIDFGGGVLGALQRHADPNAVHVLLSHLHADHCLDLPGLFVWRRYHPTPAALRGLMGMSLAGLLPSIGKLVRQSVDERATGQMLGYLQSAQFSGQVVGPVIGGQIGVALGLHSVFFVTGALLAACAGLAHWARGR